ncbi:MAG TPA: ATP synthase F1 subunit delta [Draconibacterium sp.]|jgi:F-type H+-transporting ATPase subunit delta|nr:ATP synthase F1 subunit delta [Draconibacterium sp.]
MTTSAIRVRYAKAFFLLAKEKKMLDTLKTDIQKVSDVCTISPEFINMIESPVIKTSKKTELITAIFKTEIHRLTLNFLVLITNNKRENYIPGICRNFLEMTREDQKIKSAVLITASEINPKANDKIRNLLEKELNATVELNCKTRPEIIGGLILRIDDRQYDSSVATQLRKIKHLLLEK